MIKSFEISGISIPMMGGSIFSRHGYQPVLSKTDLRMANATTRRQVYSGTQKKISITLSSSGMPAPPGISELDLTAVHTVKCGIQRSVGSISNAITLPINRRTDVGYEPLGWAIVNGYRESVSINIVGDVATLGVVAGATGYAVDYFPEISAFVDFKENADSGEATFSWDLTCTEV